MKYDCALTGLNKLDLGENAVTSNNKHGQSSWPLTKEAFLIFNSSANPT